LLVGGSGYGEIAFATALENAAIVILRSGEKRYPGIVNYASVNTTATVAVVHIHTMALFRRTGFQRDGWGLV